MAEQNNEESSKTKVTVSPQMLQLQKSLASGKSVIGIDIGVSSVNVAQTVLYKGKQTLIKVVVEEIGMVSDPEREQVTIDALKNALSSFNTKQADVICTVSNQKSVVDYVVMPLMPEAELLDAVRFEVGSSSHFQIENPIIDFKLAGRINDKEVEKLNVMVAVVAKDSIEQIKSKFKSVTGDPLAQVKKLLFVEDHMGLNLTKIIPMSLALENLVKKSELKLKETIATLEIGSMTAEFNVYREGGLEFSRRINVTGVDFTRCLTSALFGSTGKVELTMQEAESVKKEYGIPKASEEYLIKDKMTANQAISLLRPKLEQLIKEITRSFDLYYGKERVGTINKLVLFGGGSMLKRLPEFLNAEVGLPVELGNPLQDVDCLFEGVVASEEQAQRAALAIGASMAQPSGINFLPEKARNSKNKLVQRLLLVSAAFVLVICSILLYVLLTIRLGHLQQESDKIKDGYQTMIPKLRTMKEKLLIQNLTQHRFNMAALLRDMSHLSEQVYLKTVSLNGMTLTISGVVSANARASKKLLAPLLSDLKKRALSDVAIASIQEDAFKTNSEFKIEAKVVLSGRSL